MPLSPDDIAAIYAKKATRARPTDKKPAQGARGRKLTRVATQYTKLPFNYLVKHIEGPSKPCESYGCKCPSYHTLRKEPLCQLHLIYALVHEINLLSHNGSVRPDTGVIAGVAARNGAGSLDAASPSVATPVVTANLITEGTDSDDGSYL
jgi:hypothetical protein